MLDVFNSSLIKRNVYLSLRSYFGSNKNDLDSPSVLAVSVPSIANNTVTSQTFSCPFAAIRNAPSHLNCYF